MGTTSSADAGSARLFDAAVGRAGRLVAVPASALRDPSLAGARARARAERRTRTRSAWWYPVALLLLGAAALFAGLRLDQRVAALLVWPTEGASFVEVGASPADAGYRRTMVVVAAGLNRRSGALIAESLLPSIGGDDTRVFGLVYGNSIVDDDIDAKFDALFREFQPRRLLLVGSSMGGDVALNIATHFQETFADRDRYLVPSLAPRLDAVFLDCTPLGTDDVRLAARTQADMLTALTERIGTAGGAGTRLVAEMLVTQSQWSSGNFPLIVVKPDDLAYKLNEVFREKLGSTGVSTRLVRDQYGVIRRFDPDRVFGTLGAGVNVVFLRPVDAAADTTIDVAQVQDRLRVLAAAYEFDLTVLDVPGGSHASAVRDAAVYNPLIAQFRASVPAESVFFPLR